MLRNPHCLDNRLIDGGEVVSPTWAAIFSPETFLNISGTLLETELTSGPGAFRYDCKTLSSFGARNRRFQRINFVQTEKKNHML
jgi:hypothetical protein